MALLSPGVQVSVIDQSNYTPAAAGSIPYFLIATAQNKISGAGTGIAPGTLAVNANKLYLMTSQRDLLSTYGTPFFYNTTAGTPINGYELNEYGLLAAYSALGVTNLAYVQRVDIDLSALTATLNRPVAAPANGTYWLDTTNSKWGINQWNQTTSAFTNQVPSVITDTVYLETESTVPLQSYGSIGNYAVIATSTTNPIYYKRGGPTTAQAPAWIQDSYSADQLYNTWVLVGSDEWKTSWAAVQGTTTPSSLPVGNSIVINNHTVTIASSPNNTVQHLVSQINGALNSYGVYAANIAGSLNLYADSTANGADLTVTGATVANSVATLTFATTAITPFTVGSSITVDGIVDTATGSEYNGTYTVTACGNSSVSYASTATGDYTSGGTITQPGTIYIANGTGTPLSTLGITAGSYASPAYFAGANYQAPRWRATDTVPEPTGSIFQQTNSVNLGTTLIVKQYNSTLGTYVLQPCPVYPNNAAASYALDPVNGGQSIPAGTTYAQVDPYGNSTTGFQLLERLTPGATVITGTAINPTFATTITVTGASGTGSVATLTFAEQATALFAVGSTITVAGLTSTGSVYNGSHTVSASTTTSVSWAGTAAGSYVSGGTITSSATYSTFTISATEPETGTYTTPVTVIVFPTSGTATAADFVSAVSSAGVENVSATVNSSGAIVFTHATGGDIILVDGLHYPIATAGFDVYTSPSTAYSIGVTYVNLTNPDAGYQLSNWVTTPTFTYIANSSPPEIDPASGTYWYYSDATTADIMIQNNGAWMGYQMVSNDVRGYNLTMTNATGPIFSATAPTTQTNTAQSPLVYGDLWIDTSDLELYPMINRWETVNGQDQWVAISNADQTTINGVLFADARWAPNGTTNPVTDPIPPITSLLISDYLDLDAPNPLLYPEGMLLWNTRRSGFNVKSFEANYFNATSYPYPDVLPDQTSTWLSVSGLREDGSPNMGRQAQRALIVKALRTGIETNTQIRENQVQFNLLACPQYPELAPDMVVLNNDRGDTGFIIVDTPLRLAPADVVTWATDNNGLGVITGDGNLAVGQAYAAAFYPSCKTTDLSGNLVVTAPSHMMVRTIIRSDAVSYPWFAPAGLRRGVVDNAIQLGYINSITGEFTPTSINQGLRDVLYLNDVNPITFIPGSGITNFGNHTLQGNATALDRINVARLVAYLRGQLEVIGNQYLFEPNDTITRSAIAAQITSLMNALVSQRGIYDYLVVCDLTNNTPATIDANELYVDIAIEPTKAVEFIYIPMRIQNTGTIAAQGSA